MAFHLADCLQRFGPCRAWWSFSMERLMAQVLKSSGNNRLGKLLDGCSHSCQIMEFHFAFSSGELEITYQKNFGRIGNLRSLLESQNFPPSLDPIIRQIRAMYDPIPFVSKTQQHNPKTPLEADFFRQLVDQLNNRFPLPNKKWIASDSWSKLRPSVSKNFVPVNAKVEQLKDFKVDDVVFSTFKANNKNSAIALKPNAPVKYGFIQSVFRHTRSAPGLYLTNTWLVVQPLVPVSSVNNPFNQLTNYPINVALRQLKDDEKYVIPVDDILAHCAWLTYKPRTISDTIDFETVAVVCIDR